MRTIGLLGGMSWESSVEYYRIINEEARRRLGGTHSAKSVMYSVDWVKPDAGEFLNHLERSLGGMVDVLQMSDLPPTRLAFGSSSRGWILSVT